MARTSPLSGIYEIPSVGMPQGLPSWVMGGDFNAIEQGIVGMDRQRAALEQDRIGNEFNQLRQQQLQGQMDYQDALGERLKTAPPTTMQEAYTVGMQTALENGQTDQYLQFQEAMEKQAEQERVRQIQAITSAPGLLRAGMDEGAGTLMDMSGLDRNKYINPQVIATNEKLRNAGGQAWGVNGEGQWAPVFGSPRGSGGGSDSKGARDEFINAQGQVAFVYGKDPKAEEKIAQLVNSGYQPGLKYDPIDAMLGGMTPSNPTQQNSQNQKAIVEEIKSKPPPALPGEKYEDYKRRVNGK